VPYTFFGTGIGYRTDRIDPALVESAGLGHHLERHRLQGPGVGARRRARSASRWRCCARASPTSTPPTPPIIDQALADVTELIDLVNVKVNIEGYKDIPEGTTTIAQTWSADLIAGAAGYLPEGVTDEVLGFWHPPAGQYVVTNDAMGVLADAEPGARAPVPELPARQRRRREELQLGRLPAGHHQARRRLRHRRRLRARAPAQLRAHQRRDRAGAVHQAAGRRRRRSCTKTAWAKFTAGG
jgi:hypothetical protein